MKKVIIYTLYFQIKKMKIKKIKKIKKNKIERRVCMEITKGAEERK